MASSTPQPLRSITTRFSRPIWNKFVQAVEEYGLIRPGDRIAVCVSGGKDSMLLASLLQLYQSHGGCSFELEYLTLDPGYRPENRAALLHNARLLGFAPTVVDIPIFKAVNGQEHNPCFLCSRLRRGNLYEQARRLGCNKIALGHHFDDVIETILMAMVYGGQIQTMLPRRTSDNYPEIQLIRPLYLIKERDILAWRDANGLSFLACSCDFAAKGPGEGSSKRAEVKALIAELRKKNPQVEMNIFNSVKNVNLKSIMGYHMDGERHSFLERLDSPGQ